VGIGQWVQWTMDNGQWTIDN